MRTSAFTWRFSLHLWLFVTLHFPFLAVLLSVFFPSLSHCTTPSSTWPPPLTQLHSNHLQPLRHILLRRPPPDHLAVWSGPEPRFDLLPHASGWKVASWTPALCPSPPPPYKAREEYVCVSLCVCVFRAETGPLCLWIWPAEAADFRQRCLLVCFPACLSAVCVPVWLFPSMYPGAESQTDQQLSAFSPLYVSLPPANTGGIIPIFPDMSLV